MKVVLEKADTVAGEQFRLVISDTGPGMQADKLKHLFEPIEKTQGPPSMEEGIGLGLFITNYVVNRYQGRAWAESVFGEGVTFYIELPIKKSV